MSCEYLNLEKDDFDLVIRCFENHCIDDFKLIFTRLNTLNCARFIRICKWVDPQGYFIIFYFCNYSLTHTSTFLFEDDIFRSVKHAWSSGYNNGSNSVIQEKVFSMLNAEEKIFYIKNINLFVPNAA